MLKLVFVFSFLDNVENEDDLVALEGEGGGVKDGRIRENSKKLMFYLDEANIGRGYIKEPCFSSDGRVLCSPYKEGVRLLAFGDKCPQYPNSLTAVQGYKGNPRPLTIIKNIASHDNYVLCSTFSPREPLLVVGCRKGKLSWIYPYL